MQNYTAAQHSTLQGHTSKQDAKIDFRACMDRLSRDLKLYRISPQVSRVFYYMMLS